jgi:hypothetical protein
MHRGSSKGETPSERSPEILPLSASGDLVSVDFEIVRGGRSSLAKVWVARGALLRTAIRLAGHSPEGSAVLDGEVPLPMDSPITASCRYLLIPTFSGG